MADYREALARIREREAAKGRDLSPSATRSHSIDDHQIDNAEAVIREYEMVKDDPYLLREWKKASTGNLRNIKRLQNAQRLLSRVAPQVAPQVPPQVAPQVAPPITQGGPGWPPAGTPPLQSPPSYGSPPDIQEPSGPVGAPPIIAEIPIDGPTPGLNDMAPDYNLPGPKNEFEEYIEMQKRRQKKFDEYMGTLQQGRFNTIF